MDRALIIRAQSGDHEAFAAIAAAWLGRLEGIARLILRDEGAAEDAAQETIVEAWRSLRGLREPDRFEAWLHRILVRACADRARRDGHRRLRELRLTSSVEPAGSDAARSTAIRDQLERGLARLTLDQRAVLVLTYYLDLPAADAATILGIPVGTLKSRLHRSLDALRAVVEADEREPAGVQEWSA